MGSQQVHSDGESNGSFEDNNSDIEFQGKIKEQQQPEEPVTPSKYEKGKS